MGGACNGSPGGLDTVVGGGTEAGTVVGGALGGAWV